MWSMGETNERELPFRSSRSPFRGQQHGATRLTTQKLEHSFAEEARSRVNEGIYTSCSRVIVQKTKQKTPAARGWNQTELTPRNQEGKMGTGSHHIGFTKQALVNLILHRHEDDIDSLGVGGLGKMAMYFSTLLRFDKQSAEAKAKQTERAANSVIQRRLAVPKIEKSLPGLVGPVVL